MTDVLDPLRRRAQSDPTAQLELVHALYDAGRHDEALATLGQAARGGNLAAVVELGSRLATGAGAPLAFADGRDLLRFAAQAGVATAARHLAILAGSGIDGAPDWQDALDWTKRAAAQGDSASADDLKLLAVEAGHGDIALAPWLAPAQPHVLSQQPCIAALPGVASAALCAQLVAHGRDDIQAAGVTDRRTGTFMHDAARTNGFAQVKLFDCGLPLLLLRARLAAAAGQPVAHCEIMNLLSYRPGEAFAPHHDYLDPAEPGFADELARDGQRVATALVYLSDDFDGGETDFPAAAVRYRGHVGDGLLFRNVGADGRVDPATLHAGLPPTRGRKWVLSQWVRDRPQRQV